MGYFQFSITLKSGELLQFIRQLPSKDLDQIWRSHDLKAKDHYKSKLLSFRVIQLSKLDSEIKKWISDQGKHETKAMDDLLLDPGELGRTVNRKKKPGNEGQTLENRL